MSAAFDPREREMSRDLGQVLYRYRPGQTFDHSGNYTAQVRQYAHDEAFDGTEVDPGFLIAESMRFVRRWRREGLNPDGAEAQSDRAPEFPADDVPLADQEYQLVIPGKVFCRVWPRIVRCTAAGCGLIWEAAEWTPGAPWPGPCPRCKSAQRHRQLQYVFVHPCGEIHPLQPPTHGRFRQCAHQDGFRLNDKASRFMDFRWECLRCGASEPVQSFCNNPGCTWNDKKMGQLVHTASSAYSGKGLTLVNVPTREAAERSSKPAFVVATIAQWLKLCDAEEAERLIGGDRGPEISPVMLESIEKMRSSGVPELAEQADKLLSSFKSPDVEAVRARVADVIGFDPLGDDGQGRILASSLSSYDRVLHQPKIKLADLKAAPASSGRANLYPTYDIALERAGLVPASLALITEFPATYVAIGYCRGGFGPGEADLVAYKGRARRGQAMKTLIYAHPTQTEALIFALDEDRVGRWLVANKAATAGELEAAGGAKRWFAARLDGFDGQLPPPWDNDHDPHPGDPDYGPRLVFGLIHSMAHQILRSLSVDSGYAETALSEYLFPYDLAFAIHPNGGSDFVLGGLRTVMEQNLDEVVTRAVDNATCIYDPNCNDANRGADHGCMFLPETSCQAWNWFVSRWYLFGSPGPEMVGYWSPAVVVP